MSINYEIIMKRLRNPNDSVNNNWTFAQIPSVGVISRKAGETEFTPDITEVYDYFNYSSIIWGTTPPLTELECEIEWQVYQNELALQEVQQKRAVEYPGWQEFADDMWHAMDSGLLPKVEPWFTECETVKTNNPLP